MNIDQAITRPVLYRKSFEAWLHGKQPGLLKGLLHMDSNTSANASQESEEPRITDNPQIITDRQRLIRLLAPLAEEMPFEYSADIPEEWRELLESAIKVAHAELQEQQQGKKRRGKHVPSVSLVTKDPVEVLIRSDLFTQQIMRGLLDGKKYTQYPDRLIAEYRQSFAKDKGQIIITISPGSGESWDHVLRSLSAMGDGIRDTFAALLIIAIDAHGAEHITQPFYINPDDILATCQREKAKGSYRPLQRAEVIEHLRTLSQAKVQAAMTAPYKRRGKTVEYRAESALIDVLSGKIGAYELITGEELWVKRSIKIGDWAAMVPELNKQTAIMLREVLKLHAKHQKHAKRLGQYLTFMFRANAHRGCYFQCSMEVLLEQAGITPDLKHPGDTRNLIEQALATLQTKSIIGKYGLVVDSVRDTQIVQERIEQRAYHWWDDYKQQQWYFNPPDTIKVAYQRLLKEG